MSDQPKCAICGEPMPPGEEMFKYHGYSGDCPKPPLPKEPAPDNYVAWLRFIPGEPDGEGDALELCGSNDERAFKVYRHPAPVAERPPAQQQQPQTERDCREEFEQFCRTEYGWMDFRGSDGDDDYYDTRISEAWDFWQGAWLTWVPELTPDAPAAPMTTTDARPSSGR